MEFKAYKVNVERVIEVAREANPQLKAVCGIILRQCAKHKCEDICDLEMKFTLDDRRIAGRLKTKQTPFMVYKYYSYMLREAGALVLVDDEVDDE